MVTAHNLALGSEHLRADMVEVTEFPLLAVKYNIQGVTVTIINEGPNKVGAVPEKEIVKTILHVIGK